MYNAERPANREPSQWTRDSGGSRLDFFFFFTRFGQFIKKRLNKNTTRHRGRNCAYHYEQKLRSTQHPHTNADNRASDLLTMQTQSETYYNWLRLAIQAEMYTAQHTQHTPTLNTPHTTRHPHDTHTQRGHTRDHQHTQTQTIEQVTS